MRFSLPGEEFYEASPYEPVTARLSDIFRLASIFSGEWACAGALTVLLRSPGEWQRELTSVKYMGKAAYRLGWPRNPFTTVETRGSRAWASMSAKERGRPKGY